MCTLGGASTFSGSVAILKPDDRPEKSNRAFTRGRISAVNWGGNIIESKSRPEGGSREAALRSDERAAS